MSTPTTTSRWSVETKTGFSDLQLHSSVPLPELSDTEVLVKMEYASLNYRDLLIALGKYGFAVKYPIVPGSDGSGTVAAIGRNVSRWKVGDNVCVTFNQRHIAGPGTKEAVASGVGGVVDGTLAKFGVFSEEGLVRMPGTLGFKEAATLTCAGVTAWNALYGTAGKELKVGDWVLTQGTGGVSLFAVQLAKAAGARVIATSSSEEKLEMLKELGADFVINYKEDKNWGETAKNLTEGKEGVNHVVEVGGPNTMAQSLRAVKMEGVINVIGFLGGFKGEEQPNILEVLSRTCTVRGFLVGSRTLFEDMVRAIDAMGIKPVVDKKEWGFDELKEAYQYMVSSTHSYMLWNAD